MTRPEEDEPEDAHDPGDLDEAALDPGDPEDNDLADDEESEDDDSDDDGDLELSDEELDPKAAQKKPAAKTAGEEDEEEEILHPKTPVPTLEKMLEALQWAFEAEENLEEGLLERFAQHALLILEKNREMNLTTILDPREVAAKHYLDSWRITRLVPLMARKVLDLGTGAGFPGLPVAMAEPNLSMVVVDSKKKKADFVEDCIEKLGVKNAHSVWARAEDHLTKDRVDVVLVRAISSVRENVRTLRKVRHSLKDLVMLKGPSWSREVRAGEREAERLGFKLDTVWEHELPGEMGKRAILVYRAPGGAGT